MSEADYYPDGAYSDPNAPYNQVYAEDVYGDDALEQVKDEIKTFDPFFCEFVVDQIEQEDADRMEMPNDIYSKEWEKWYSEQDCSWRDKKESLYVDFRLDDVIAELAEHASIEPDYDYDEDESKYEDYL